MFTPATHASRMSSPSVMPRKARSIALSGPPFRYRIEDTSATRRGRVGRVWMAGVALPAAVPGAATMGTAPAAAPTAAVFTKSRLCMWMLAGWGTGGRIVT